MSARAMRVWTVLAAITFVAAFHAIYVAVIAPVYAYEGSVYQPADGWAVPIAAAFAILPSLWLPTTLKAPSQVAIWLLYLIGYIPASLVPYYFLGAATTTLLPLSATLCVSMAILSVMGGIPRSHWVPPLQISSRAYGAWILAACGLAIVFVAVTIGITFELPSLEDVYDTRAVFVDEIAAFGPLLSYIIVWSVNAAAPIAIAVGIRQGSYWLAGAGIAVQLIIYGVTGFRSALFSSVLIVALLVLLALPGRAKPALMTFGGAALMAAIAIWDATSGGIVATSIFVRRLLEIPGHVNALYFEYFQDHPTYHLAHSFLSAWLQPPSRLQPPEAIGAAYFGPSTYANGGIWADAISNFGLIGVLVFSVVLGGWLWLLDVVADGADLPITGAVTGIFAISLTNTGLFTTMLSLGFGPALVGLALLPRASRPGKEVHLDAEGRRETQRVVFRGQAPP